MWSTESPAPSDPKGPLILCLGNPIVANDQVGLLVGSRLREKHRSLGLRTDVEILDFAGSPLGLLAAVAGRDTVVLIDSISTGKRPVGSVTAFGPDEIYAYRGDLYLHGMNLAGSLDLGRRWGMRLPRRLVLVGIEVGPITVFGDTLSAEIAGGMERIHAEVERIVVGLVGT